MKYEMFKAFASRRKLRIYLCMYQLRGVFRPQVAFKLWFGKHRCWAPLIVVTLDTIDTIENKRKRTPTYERNRKLNLTLTEFN